MDKNTHCHTESKKTCRKAKPKTQHSSVSAGSEYQNLAGSNITGLRSGFHFSIQVLVAFIYIFFDGGRENF